MVDDHLSAELIEAVQDAKERLRARFGNRFRSLILFGSRAWGRPHPQSDVDLCIVIEGLTQHDRSDAIEIVAGVAVDRLAPLSPLVFGSEQLDRYLSIEYRLAEDITRRGIAL